MNPEEAVRELESELKNLEGALARETANERRASLSIFLVTSVISVVILGFVLANYFHFKKEWTPENFSTSLQKELDELNPTAMKELQTLGEELLPVYATESRKQFDRMGPTLANKLVEQLDRIGDDLKQDAHGRLATSENRIRDETQKIILECYPGFNDDAERAKLNDAFRRITETAVAKTITDFDAQFTKDVNEVRDALLKFDIKETNEPTIDLQKKFISLWLRQLDQEIQKL